MSTEYQKRQDSQSASQRNDLPLQEDDLAPTKEQSEQLRGGVLPPNDIRGVYVTPPEG